MGADSKTNHFKQKVCIAKIALEKNPDMESLLPMANKKFMFDNPFPFSVDKTKVGGSFDVGQFLGRLIRDSKKNPSIPAWQTKILHEELGEKWERLQLPKRRVLNIATMKARPENYQKESFRIFLGRTPAPSTRKGKKDIYVGGFSDRCESEKALVELQKRLDKNPDIDPLKLKKDFEEEYLKK